MKNNPEPAIGAETEVVRKSAVETPATLPISSQTAPPSHIDGQLDADAGKDEKLNSTSSTLTSWQWRSAMPVIQLIIGICCIGTTWFVYKRMAHMDAKIAELSARLDKMYGFESLSQTENLHTEL